MIKKKEIEVKKLFTFSFSIQTLPILVMSLEWRSKKLQLRRGPAPWAHQWRGVYF